MKNGVIKDLELVVEQLMNRISDLENENRKLHETVEYLTILLIT